MGLQEVQVEEVIPFEGYAQLEHEGRFAMFVNSSTPPEKEVPLHHYRYVQDGHEFDFFRLYRITYLMGGYVNTSLYDWKRIEVKEHCVAALVHLIDSFAALREFVDE